MILLEWWLGWPGALIGLILFIIGIGLIGWQMGEALIDLGKHDDK